MTESRYEMPKADTAGSSGRIARIPSLLDESWALSNRDGRFDGKVLVGAGALLYLDWNAGTAIGVVSRGIDALMNAVWISVIAVAMVTSRTRARES